MGEDPRAIRQEIAMTRESMGDTVDALAYKSDVKARAKESVSDKVTRVREKVTGAKTSMTESIVGAKDSVSDTMSERTPDSGDVQRQAKRAVGVAQENPVGLALGAVAFGFLAGMLMPSTRVEDEKLGPVADQVRDRAQETGQAALEHGKQVAQDVAQTARDAGQQAVGQVRETAMESGRRHAEEVKGEAQDQAAQARESVGSSPSSPPPGGPSGGP
jgi:gas vesicle protein